MNGLDIFMKNKLSKYLKDMFEIIGRNLQKTTLNQLVEFCDRLRGLKQLGFEILSQMSLYSILGEVHFKMNSYYLKVLEQMGQLQSLG